MVRLDSLETGPPQVGFRYSVFKPNGTLTPTQTSNFAQGSHHKVEIRNRCKVLRRFPPLPPSEAISRRRRGNPKSLNFRAQVDQREAGRDLHSAGQSRLMPAGVCSRPCFASSAGRASTRNKSLPSPVAALFDQGEKKCGSVRLRKRPRRKAPATASERACFSDSDMCHENFLLASLLRAELAAVLAADTIPQTS